MKKYEYRVELTCPECLQQAVHYRGRDEFYCAACEEDVDPIPPDNPFCKLPCRVIGEPIL